MHPQELSHQNLYPTDAEQPGSSPHKGHMVRPNVTAKGRSRVKRRDASGSSDPFVDEIDQADGWMQITEVFCTHLALSGVSRYVLALPASALTRGVCHRLLYKAGCEKDTQEL